MTSGTPGKEEEKEEKEEGEAKNVVDPAQTPVRIRVQRLEAGGSSKKKAKRKREEVILDTGQKRIMDFFLKKATAESRRDSGDTTQNQGTDSGPLEGVSDSSISNETSKGDAGLHPEVRGGEKEDGAKKRTKTVLGRWPHEGTSQTESLGKEGQGRASGSKSVLGKESGRGRGKKK